MHKNMTDPKQCYINSKPSQMYTIMLNLYGDAILLQAKAGNFQ